jgi:hypothetical protein
VVAELPLDGRRVLMDKKQPGIEVGSVDGLPDPGERERCLLALGTHDQGDRPARCHGQSAQNDEGDIEPLDDRLLHVLEPPAQSETHAHQHSDHSDTAAPRVKAGLA